ncbi:MAG TPA: 4-(cytidine 5'-diphospho)-2-C-methyl-D-erythritol kinase [Gemmatimonas sp.]|uniref:4-(cytidine 5'-diphospho)-2-C-methyl-D-erythritol kinase n=1 Tax=Gemmatimonas sp. TaxID=1962908 RepID=UPI002ED95297
MTASVEERAYAKINLVLHILAREASGYHGIETLFQRLALHDVVRVGVNAGPSSLHCDGPAMPSDGLGEASSNLAWRAASAYGRANPWLTSWQIDIEKHIPVGGGLGGGSADAAAVLRALDTLAPQPLGLTRLLEIGGTLGADVPFLVSGDSRAWAWGRGDRLLALPALPPMAVTLVTFATGVNTGAAYGAFAAARDTAQTPITASRLPPHALGTWDAIAAIAANDFERVVPHMHAGVAIALPIVQRQAAALRSQGQTAIGMMSGSGATCFLLRGADADSTLATAAEATLVPTMTF